MSDSDFYKLNSASNFIYNKKVKIANCRYVKIVVYAPVSYASLIRKVLAENKCGYIGKYDYCSFSVRGIGRFRPLKGAKPFIGKKGKITKVIEERIETICPAVKLKKVLQALKKAHPYQEPVIDVYSLIDL